MRANKCNITFSTKCQVNKGRDLRRKLTAGTLQRKDGLPAPTMSSAKGYSSRDSGRAPFAKAPSRTSLTSLSMWRSTVASRTPPPKHNVTPAINKTLLSFLKIFRFLGVIFKYSSLDAVRSEIILSREGG